MLKIEVIQFKQIAQKNAELAKKIEEQAKVTERRAQENAEEARRQNTLAEVAYRECLKKKK